MSANPSRTLTAVLVKPGAWVCRSCLRRTLTAERRSFRLPSTSIFKTPKETQRHRPVPAGYAGNSSLQKRRKHAQAANAVRETPSRTPVLPKGQARTRFAPSPTGFLHIGGLRTALFSYLLAKRTGGQFLLRIEDTDQKRLVPGAEERLLEDLRWAGLQWDEGPLVGGPHGPYKQCERNAIYQEHARQLLDNGRAYRCFCRSQATGQGTSAYVTSGCYQDCSSLSRDAAKQKAEAGSEDFTVRLKRPADVKKRVYPDLIYGKIVPLKRTLTSVPSADAEAGIDAADTILIKSDGTPTYHFANVVDDHLMEITHVIRGSEWMASTPLHYDLYEAFGWVPPKFAHVGLLVDENKAKLSKRNSDLALDVRSMHEQHGVLPETLVNFLALQGWSNPLRNDVYTLDGLAEIFDIKFTKGNTMVKFDKLWYLQKQHVVRRCEEACNTRDAMAIRPVVERIAEEVMNQFPDVRKHLFTDGLLEGYCQNILLADSKSYQNAKQYVKRNRYFFDYDPSQVPATKEPNGNTHDFRQASGSIKVVEAVVAKIMMSPDYKQPHRPPPAHSPGRTDDLDTRYASDVPKASTAEEALSLEGKGARIQVVVQHELRKAALLEVLAGGFTPEDVEQKLAFTDELLSDTDLLEVYERAGAAAGQSHDALALKKRWGAALMRYMREKLSYGLPGPSLGMVMAILGYEECCRRLSMEVKPGKGW